MSKVLVIPDLHFPYVDNKQLNKIYVAIGLEKPDAVIQVGDLYDQYMFSRYDKDYEELSPKKELDKAKYMANKMWTKINKIVPKAKLYQLLGNHDIRILKQVKRKFPEIFYMIKEIFDDMYTFKKVETMKSDRDFLVIDGVTYCHGWMSRHCVHFRSPVVRGHSHKACLDLFQGAKTNYLLMYEMQVGCLADETLVPLDYPASKKTGWAAAYGLIVDGQPYLEMI